MLQFVIKRQKLRKSWKYTFDPGLYTYIQAGHAGERTIISFPTRAAAEEMVDKLKVFEREPLKITYKVVLLDEYLCEAEGKVMESWKRVFREGVAPLLSESGLRALKTALETDDPRLIQAATTCPPPLQCVQNWPVEAACAMGYCGWVGDGLKTVAEVEEFFARMCFEIDQRLGEPVGCRWFLNWFDETPRAQMRAELLPEVTKTLKERAVSVVAA